MKLIDADALIEFIDPEHLRHPGELTFSEVDVVNMLNHAPTAYDVGKVVKELEDLKMRYFLTLANTGDADKDCAYLNTANAIDKAIEIVKRGGRDEE
jgi:hypothetical protein